MCILFMKICDEFPCGSEMMSFVGTSVARIFEACAATFTSSQHEAEKNERKKKRLETWQNVFISYLIFPICIDPNERYSSRNYRRFIFFPETTACWSKHSRIHWEIDCWLVRKQHTPNGHQHFIIPFDATIYVMNRIHHILFVALCSLLSFLSILPLVHYTGSTVELVRGRKCLAWVFRTWFHTIIASLRQWCRLSRRSPSARSLWHLLRARFHIENQIPISVDAHSSFMCAATSHHPPHRRGKKEWKRKNEITMAIVFQ